MEVEAASPAGSYVSAARSFAELVQLVSSS